ncbi:hypothetical protein JCM18899A_00910 [Nocardioides sp. AN3]
MTRKPPFIIDAGPALNFLSKGHQNLLINAVRRQTINAPQSVEAEVLRNARKTRKFKGAEGRWKNMKPHWLTVLSDDATDLNLLNAAQILLNVPLEERLDEGDDLGETMVVLHAYVRARQGTVVYVIIDDAGGRTFANKAIANLARHKAAGRPVGSMYIVRTPDLIERRLNSDDIPDIATLEAIWADIAPLDDGLEDDLSMTGLLTSPEWNRPRKK